MKLTPFFILSTFLFFLTASLGNLVALAGEPLTNAGVKATFLQHLIQLPDKIDQRILENEQQYQAAIAKMQDAERRHNLSRSNVDRLAIATETICDGEVAKAVMIRAPELNLGAVRSKFKQWTIEIYNTLKADPIANAHLWYQRYDFWAQVEIYQSLEDNLANILPAIVARTCNDLDTTLYAKLRPIASRMDEINQSGQDLAAKFNDEDLSDSAREEIKRGLEQLKNERDGLAKQRDQLLKQGHGRRNAILRELRFSVESQIAKINALIIPKRGKITGQNPSKVRFRNQQRFGIHFLGSGLPTGLGAGDISLPTGLRLLNISGGGSDLYLFMEKGDALQSGRHEIDIAGEKVGFNFEDEEETDSDSFTPLVSNNNSPATNSSNNGQIPEDGKGTLLTPQSLTDHPQQQFGYWQYAKESRDQGDDERTSVLRFARFRDPENIEWTVLMGRGYQPDHYDDLIPHQRVPVEDIWAKGVIGQYDQNQGQCFGGLRATKEVPDPITGEERCPPWRWWGSSQLCFGPNNLNAREDVDSKKHNQESCETEDQHHAFDINYERFVGISFSPIVPGKYIHTLTVGTPFQYLAEVKLDWDYSILEPASLKFIIRKLENGRPGAELIKIESPAVIGEYPFSTRQTGQFQFEMQVYDHDGKLIHQDFAAAYLDR